MSQLTLSLFGPPRLSRDGAPVALDRRKALALLAYLAVTETRHTRDSLAALLWPEAEQARARGSLLRALLSLTSGQGSDWFSSDRHTLGLRVADLGLTVDVAQFRRLLAACRAHGHAEQAVCAQCLPLLRTAKEPAQASFWRASACRTAQRSTRGSSSRASGCGKSWRGRWSGWRRGWWPAAT